MSIRDLISELRELDIKLWVEDGKLRYSAPKEVMTTERLKLLAEHKLVIIEWLNLVVSDDNQTGSPLLPIARDQPIAASFAQDRLLFITSLMPGSDSYNVPIPLKLTGVLDRHALQQSLNRIIQRHESLRTHFRNDNGQYLQVIDATAELPLAHISLVDLSPNERELKLTELTKQERQRAFDLEAGPVIRASLIELSTTEHALLITLHHVVCDGWSLGILVDELSRLYSAYSTDTDIQLPELSIQYADYAVWQRQLLSTDTLQGHLSYWRKQLLDLSTLQLPTDFPRPKIQTFEGEQVYLQLPESLTSGIKKLSQDSAATLFMTMLAAFSVLMKRYCQQDDIVIGTPIANRSRVEVEALIGFFINMLVLRTDLSNDPGFGDFLQTVKKTALEAYRYQDVPFERLVEELNLSRDLSRNPLFQISFSMQNTPMRGLHLEGLNLDILPAAEVTTTRFDLEFNVSESNKNLVVSCMYNKQLFSQSTVQRLLRHYQQLLSSIVANPQQSAGKLEMLTDDEQQQMLYEWNQTQQTPLHQRLVHHSVEKLALQHGQQNAIVSPLATLDYAGLNESANQLAHYLIKSGISPGTAVTVLMNRTTHMCVSLLAILKIGCHYVPVDPEYPKKRLAFILEDTASKIVLSETSLISRVRDFSGLVVCVDDIGKDLEACSTVNPETVVAADDTAYLIYTSGSTGEPKGVEVSHSALANLVAWHQREYQPGLNDRASHLAGLGFDASVWELWPYLSCGSCVYLVPEELRLNAAELWHWIVSQGISLSFMPTPLAEAVLAEISLEDFSRPEFALRVLLTGGDKLHGGLIQQEVPFRVVNHYGPTENAVVATYADVDPRDTSEPVIGRPIDNVQTYILDEHLQAVPIGVTGGLYIGGASLAKGYLHRPDLNTEKFIPNPFPDTGSERLYLTGDLARYREDGSIEFAGRSDAQIKLQGFRIEPGEIETLLTRHPSVQSAAVLLRDANSGSARLVAYVVPEAGKNCDEDDLFFELREKLPEYMVPSRIVLLETFPLTANGKLDREALPEPKLLSRQTNTARAPDTELEKNIAALWRELLGLDDLGISDNFFDLGGHSLLLGKMHTRLKNELGATVAMVDLFRYPTIESLARHLAGDDADLNLSDRSRPQIEKRRKRLSEDEDIAVIGMAGQFPGAQNIDQYWQNLLEGVESIRFFSEAELSSAGVPDAVFKHPDYVPARGYLEDADLFDAAFFGYTPVEAELIDPQQRIFLETSQQALEHAACDPQTYPGLISVFGGVSMNGYLQNLYARPDLLAGAAVQMVISSEKDFLATRVSYKLDLKGPSFTLQTACSTSLVAIHQACRSLRDMECDVAMAGGVCVNTPRMNGYIYMQGGIMSADGHCRAFDVNASGTVPGEGVGVVVLKRLSDAIEDRDTIHAVVRGSAINNDGANKAGYTAPSISGQANVIAMAQMVAGVTPASIDYIETHGTGTALGDPIEVAALTQAFESATNSGDSEQGVCALGSLKTNIGHLDTAAGVAGFIKTVLALEHAKIPPSLHFTSANSEIDFAKTPFRVNAAVTDWPAKPDHPRRAGISSFGIGGTNAHVILEQAPPIKSDQMVSEARHGQELLVLSAKTASALDTKINQLSEYLQSHPDLRLQDVAHTLQQGRSMMEYRCMLVSNEPDHAALGLQSKSATTVQFGQGPVASKKIVFMFSGQGSQYPNMARDLYLGNTDFKRTVDRCCEILKPHLQQDLLALLYPQEQNLEFAQSQLTRTQYAQCALFVIEYATARLWMKWGVEPVAMIGHSIGEYVAACLAGVFSLEDALVLVVNRGRLMQQQPAGVMLSLQLSAEETETLIPQELKHRVNIATINAAAMCVVSGESVDIEAFEAILQQANHASQRLHTSHAFHSYMMDEVLEPFQQLMQGIKMQAPEIPIVSNVSGTWLEDSEATDAGYWARQLRSTVLFANGLDCLLSERFNCFIEVGPGSTLTSFAGQQVALLAQASGIAVFSSIRSLRQPADDQAFLLNALGQLWLSGQRLDWALVNLNRDSRRIVLPLYPFERKLYWVSPSSGNPVARGSATDALKKANPGEWFYMTSWQRQLKPVDNNPRWSTDIEDQIDPIRSGSYLVFVDDLGFGENLVQRLRQAGRSVVVVRRAESFERKSDEDFAIAVNEDDCQRLFAELEKDKVQIDEIIYMWTLGKSSVSVVSSAIDSSTNPLSEHSADEAIQLELSFYVPLLLARLIADHLVVRSADNQAHKQDQAPDGEAHEKLPMIKLWFISDALQQVTGDELLRPLKSTLLGINAVCSQEIPALQTCSIDFPDIATTATDLPIQQRRYTDYLMAELGREVVVDTDNGDYREVAYRGGYRWVKAIKPMQPECLPRNEVEQESVSTPVCRRLKQGGVYLITGGFGGIGRVLATHLAEKYQARLALVGRRPVPDSNCWDEWLGEHGEANETSQTILFIRELEAMGAEVMASSCDIGDSGQVETLLDQLNSRFGEVNGVIHSAGLPAGGLIQLKTRQAAAEILNAKVQGGMILDKHFDNNKLDFMCFCSSLASIVAPAGQVDYVAANIFLDTLAAQRRERGLYTVSIDWDAWLETGMAMDFIAQNNNTPNQAEMLQPGLTSREGIGVFIHALNQDHSQLIVSTMDIYQRLRPLLFSHQVDSVVVDSEIDGEIPVYDRPQLSTSLVAAETPSQVKLVDIWRRFFRLNEIGINDNFFELGGNSLLAIQVAADIRAQFNISMSLDKFLELGTIDKLASHIDALEWARFDATSEYVNDDSRSEFEL